MMKEPLTSQRSCAGGGTEGKDVARLVEAKVGVRLVGRMRQYLAVRLQRRVLTLNIVPLHIHVPGVGS